MKKAILSVMLLTAGYTSAGVFAAEVTPYKCDFNTEIDTGNPNFKVASNWKHIPESIKDSWGSDEYWMNYRYYTDKGYDNDGCLYVPNQYIYQNYSASGTVFDLLVTPLVKGTATLRVKPESGYSNSWYVEVYKINEDGTRGELLKKSDKNEIGTTDEWSQIQLASDLADYTRLGLRCAYVTIDDFEASSADKTDEKSIKFVTKSNSAGLLVFDQQENGMIKVNFPVKIANDGDIDLNPGDEGYSITAFNHSDNDKELFVFPIDFSLPKGETSEEFVVSGEVNPQDWKSTYQYIYLRDNLNNSVLQFPQAKYNEYAAKLVFRKAGTTSTTSFSGPLSFGMISADATENFEVYNDGKAPLVIESITVPEGFTLTGIADNMEIGANQSVSVTLTANADTKGAYSGELQIGWKKDALTSQTYKLTLNSTVIGENDWSCDFGDKAGQYPVGSIADSGISIENAYIGGELNYYLKGVSNNGNFILPLLHANAGDILSFDTRIDNSTSYELKVYASKTRDDWGEPIYELSYSDVSYSFQSKSITIEEEGDWYLKFYVKSGFIDNIAGLKLVDNPYDIYIKEVNSPDTKQNGKEISFNIKAIATQNLNASDYTVEFIGNDKVLASVESADLTADAKNEVSFAVKFTPDVEKTTTFQTYAKFIFSDGKVIESAIKEMTITNQPDFVFNTKGEIIDNEWNKPSSRTTPITFGMTNELRAKQEFEIFNWGTAPLKVSSITVPEGFSVDPVEALVASKQLQPVTIMISAETPATYSGNLIIKYLDVNGEEQTFELPVSATLLDPEKWYAPILNKEGSSEIVWPAGTIHESNVTGTQGSYYDPNAYINSYSSSDNMLISPKLHAEAGDVLDINARMGDYNSGTVKLYLSDTREGLKAEDIKPFAIIKKQIGDNETETEADVYYATDNWNTCCIEIPESGDFYIGFKFENKLRVNYFYGLKLADVAHDLVLAGESIPSEAMQNVVTTMSVSVRNFGIKAEQPENYSVAAYINGEKVSETAGSVEIPLSYRYDDATTVVPVSVRYPKVGTFPVYLELTAGDLKLTSEPVDVTFAEEVFSAEKQIGDYFNVQKDIPLNIWYKRSESVMLFTADELGLSDGDKISKIFFKGYMTKDNFVSDVKASYAFTDETELSKPAVGYYDDSKMTTIFSDAQYKWSVIGSASDLNELFTIEFNEPLVYEAGKSLMLHMRSYATNDAGQTFGWEISSTSDKCFGYAADSGFLDKKWDERKRPVLHISLAQEPATVAGTVFDGENAVEGAVVTLVSADGDNVQYEATTDAQGAYSVKVIQNNRAYDLTAVKDAKEDFLLNQTYAENATDVDFDLLDVVTVDNTTAETHAVNENAVVKLNLDIEAGHNTVVLPFSLESDEVKALFGDDTEVLYYKGSEMEGTNLHMYFAHETPEDGMIAGKPYFVSVAEKPAAARFKGKKVIDTYIHTSDANSYATFTGTYEAKAQEPGMVLFKDMEWVPVNANARAVDGVAPYSAYVAVNPETVKSVSYSIDDDFQSAVEEIDADGISDDDVIFNLQGIRVYNPAQGIYIVNGKKVVIKK